MEKTTIQFEYDWMATSEMATIASLAINAVRLFVSIREQNIFIQIQTI